MSFAASVQPGFVCSPSRIPLRILELAAPPAAAVRFRVGLPLEAQQSFEERVRAVTQKVPHIFVAPLPGFRQMTWAHQA